MDLLRSEVEEWDPCGFKMHSIATNFSCCWCCLGYWRETDRQAVRLELS